MTIKAPINPGHMVPNSMEVYIAKKWSDPLLQLGLYKDQSLAAAGESVDDVYSNGTIKKTKDWDKVTVSITAHELTVEKLEILQYWLVSLNPGTVTGEVEEYLPGTWAFDKDIMLKYSNADNTAVTVSSVKALIDWVEETLVADTDYTVWVNMFGSTYIKLLEKDSTHATRKLDVAAPVEVKLTITYSATNAEWKVMEHKANAIAKPFVMVLVNEFEYDGEKKYIRTWLDNCQASKATLQQIADSDNTTVGFPVEITGNVLKQEWKGFNLPSAD